MNENKVTIKERVKNFTHKHKDDLLDGALMVTFMLFGYQLGKHDGIIQTHIAWLNAALEAKTNN